jgi:hypothetical protein
MIRSSCEGGTFSDEDILDGFENKSVVAEKGPDVVEIGNYWRKLKTIYDYKKGDDQTTVQQIKTKLDEGYYAMVTVNSNIAPFVYHCVLFEDFDGINVRYWNPDPMSGHQTATEEDFNKMRKDNGGLMEVHFIKKK